MDQVDNRPGIVVELWVARQEKIRHGKPNTEKVVVKHCVVEKHVRLFLELEFSMVVNKEEK